MPNYVIPNVLHFVWFGNEITRCKETLTAWRKLHSNHVINLWTSTNTLFPRSLEDIKKLCSLYKINLRDIRQETELDLHALILEEVNKGRYWTASDAARFSILNEEPGFYFDVGIIPKEPLPEKISCTQGFLLTVDVKSSIANKSIFLNYNLFCSAYKKHPFFKKITSLINANFEFLDANSAIENNFYDAFKKKRCEFYPDLTDIQQANYIFARIMTGSVAPIVLLGEYIYNIRDDIKNNNLKIFPDYFKHQSLLHIPPGRDFNWDNLLYKQFNGYIKDRILLNTAKTVNCALADKMNSRLTLKFFPLQVYDTSCYLLTELEENEQEDKISALEKMGGIHLGLGKNNFFTQPEIDPKQTTCFPKKSGSEVGKTLIGFGRNKLFMLPINSSESIDKIQTFINTSSCFSR